MDERKEGQAKRIKRQKEGMNKVNPASHPSSLPFPLSLSLSHSLSLRAPPLFLRFLSPSLFSGTKTTAEGEEGWSEGAAESGENELRG